MFFKVLHDVEYQKVWRSGVPEVFHFDQSAPTKLTKAWQELIMAMNPGMTGKGFRSLLRYDRAFSNFTGFDYPTHPPRADYINNLDLDGELPVLDKSRVCGGALLKGTLRGVILTIETLNGYKPPPPLEYILNRPWLYFEAITVRPDGSNGRFPQNGGRKVYFPLVASGRVTVRINAKRRKTPYPCVKII